MAHLFLLKCEVSEGGDSCLLCSLMCTKDPGYCLAQTKCFLISSLWSAVKRPVMIYEMSMVLQ